MIQDLPHPHTFIGFHSSETIRLYKDSHNKESTLWSKIRGKKDTISKLQSVDFWPFIYHHRHFIFSSLLPDCHVARVTHITDVSVVIEKLGLFWILCWFCCWCVQGHSDLWDLTWAAIQQPFYSEKQPKSTSPFHKILLSYGFKFWTTERVNVMRTGTLRSISDGALLNAPPRTVLAHNCSNTWQ